MNRRRLGRMLGEDGNLAGWRTAAPSGFGTALSIQVTRHLPTLTALLGLAARAALFALPPLLRFRRPPWCAVPRVALAMSSASPFPVLHLAPWTLQAGEFAQIIDIRLTADGHFRVWIEFPGQAWVWGDADSRAWGDADSFVLVSVRHRWELVTTATDWAVTRRADGRPAAIAHSSVAGPSTTPPATTSLEPDARPSRPSDAPGDADGEAAPGDADGESPLRGAWARSPAGDDGPEP